MFWHFWCPLRASSSKGAAAEERHCSYFACLESARAASLTWQRTLRRWALTLPRASHTYPLFFGPTCQGSNRLGSECPSRDRACYVLWGRQPSDASSTPGYLHRMHTSWLSSVTRSVNSTQAWPWAVVRCATFIFTPSMLFSDRWSSGFQFLGPSCW